MSKQKILFEAGPMLDGSKTGVGYYVNHLVSSLNELYSDKIDLTGYYFNFLNRRSNTVPAGNSLKFIKIHLMPGKIISLCRRLGFQPWLELFIHQSSDTIIFTNYVSLPQLQNRKTVLIVYDMSYLDVPQFSQDVNLKYLKRFCTPSLRNADVIITISEFTKERLMYHFPNLKANVVVTPISPIIKNVKKTELSSSLLSRGIEMEKYILFVGTIEPRKNLVSLIDAYAALSPDLRLRYSLVLAGGKGWKDDGILAEVAKRQNEGLNIITTGYISEDDKNALYSNAACFVMPSHYEGFGMPILEAMQHGSPIALSNIPVFHEVADDAAVYFEKDNVLDIADKISLILNDLSLRQSLGKRGEARLKAFSWERNATAVYQALE